MHAGLMIRSSQVQGSFTNALLSNLKTADMKIFLQAKIILRNMKGYTIEDKALTSQ